VLRESGPVNRHTIPVHPGLSRHGVFAGYWALWGTA
jgi:hypothetical protein